MNNNKVLQDFLAQAGPSYRRFKKMYVVDNITDSLKASDDFIGKNDKNKYKKVDIYFLKRL